MRSSILFFLLFFSATVFGQKPTVYEQSGGTKSPTYSQIIEWWKSLAAASPYVKVMEMGPTDAGYPLHLVLISGDKDFLISSLKSKKKNIILINNGIHPGEPDGIDASIVLAKEIVSAFDAADKRVLKPRSSFVLPVNVVLAIIPVYNIGGCLDRSINYRIDQDGPVEKGFRGNSENLDLNRDFIKCDSKEAISFAKIFHYLDPDVFIDNHVSDGADYQHVMTLLTSQHNKLGGAMGEYMDKQFEPALYASMKQKGYDLVPYVNHFGDTPEKGWSAYWDGPRYSSGFATLWSSFSFTPETHMLKPYKQRVDATKALMKSFIEFTASHGEEIRNLRAQTRKEQHDQERFPIAWKLDRTQSSMITYKGYEAGYKPSEVSGLPRLYYDRSKPFEKQVPFYNTYVDTLSIKKPKAYIIPQGWWKVIERLQANGIIMFRLPEDREIDVEWYHIDAVQSGARQYEGHHLNNNVQLTTNTAKVLFRKGDYVIPMIQEGNRFLMEVLEPKGEDSYFAWNFFDPILGQKEGYSDYHFEDIAADYLKKHPELQRQLEEQKAKDPAFAKSADQQLNFVFRHSPYFESAYMRYPVYRQIH